MVSLGSRVAFRRRAAARRRQVPAPLLCIPEDDMSGDAKRRSRAPEEGLDYPFSEAALMASAAPSRDGLGDDGFGYPLSKAALMADQSFCNAFVDPYAAHDSSLAYGAYGRPGCLPLDRTCDEDDDGPPPIRVIHVGHCL